MHEHGLIQIAFLLLHELVLLANNHELSMPLESFLIRTAAVELVRRLLSTDRLPERAILSLSNV